MPPSADKTTLTDSEASLLTKIVGIADESEKGSSYIELNLELCQGCPFQCQHSL